MLHSHPARVLLVVAGIAVAFFALSFPGARDTEGAWYYISSIGWFGFLITTLVLIVLAVIVGIRKFAGRRTAVSD